MAKVSVIIPAYNAAEHLRQTLHSVLNQSYGDFEVIVVDDGSTDGTVEILKTYGTRIRWAVQEHRGQAYAINRGIELATGEYVAYFDADDAMAPTKLEVQARYLDDHSDVDVVYGDLYLTKPGCPPTRIQYQPLDPFFLLQYCCVCRITIMHRRACLDRIGLFNGEITGSDDWDMWIRMSEQCCMAYLDQALSEYRIHRTNTSTTRPKRLNHVRWARVVILQGAWVRRGRPFWLRMMLLSAQVYWLLGRTPFLGERFPRGWSLADRVQRGLERLLLGWMATPPRPLKTGTSPASISAGGIRHTGLRSASDGRICMNYGKHENG